MCTCLATFMYPLQHCNIIKLACNAKTLSKALFIFIYFSESLQLQYYTSKQSFETILVQ